MNKYLINLCISEKESNEVLPKKKKERSSNLLDSQCKAMIAS
jgi:hypothetical protein